MKITNNGKEPDRLIGGTVPFASRFEVHEMAVEGGMMKMRQLSKGLEIKPGETVELKPGGYHVMFMDLTSGLKEGEAMKGTLVFEKAGTVEVEYRVGPIGGGAPWAAQAAGIRIIEPLSFRGGASAPSPESSAASAVLVMRIPGLRLSGVPRNDDSQ